MQNLTQNRGLFAGLFSSSRRPGSNRGKVVATAAAIAMTVSGLTVLVASQAQAIPYACQAANDAELRACVTTGTNDGSGSLSSGDSVTVEVEASFAIAATVTVPAGVDVTLESDPAGAGGPFSLTLDPDFALQFHPSPDSPITATSFDYYTDPMFDLPNAGSSLTITGLTLDGAGSETPLAVPSDYAPSATQPNGNPMASPVVMGFRGVSVTGAGASVTLAQDAVMQNFSNTVSPSLAGAIFASGNAVVNVGDNAVMQNNTASASTALAGCGGAIVAIDNTTVNVSGTAVFQGDSAGVGGGAISAATYYPAGITKWPGVAAGGNQPGTTVNISGSAMFEDGTASFGGDVYATGDLYVSGDAVFKNSSAGYYGSAIYSVGATGNVTKITGNVDIFNDTIPPTALNLGGAVGLAGSGVITIDGNVQIHGNSSNYGGAIWLNNGTAGATTVLNLAGNVQIYDNQALGANACGGALALTSYSNQSKTVNITGDVQIYGNSSATYGGGLCINGGTVTINGDDPDGAVQIYDNTAYGTHPWNGTSGGGLFVETNPGYSSAGGYTIEGNVDIRDNHATVGPGGGLSIDGNVALFTLSGNVRITGNTAATNGGGVLIQNQMQNSTGNGGVPATGNTVVNMTGPILIDGNSAVADGGGIEFETGTLNINADGNGDAATISNNTAALGGGMYVANPPTSSPSGAKTIANVNAGTIENNTASGPDLPGSKVDPAATVAGGSGGGIYTEKYANLFVGAPVVFRANLAPSMRSRQPIDNTWVTDGSVLPTNDWDTYQANVDPAVSLDPTVMATYIGMNDNAPAYNNYDINYMSDTIKVFFMQNDGTMLGSSQLQSPEISDPSSVGQPTIDWIGESMFYGPLNNPGNGASGDIPALNGFIPNDPTRSGYTFVGWNTMPDGSGTNDMLTAGCASDPSCVQATGTNFAEDTLLGTTNATVYAQWVANVTYDPNYPTGGLGETGSVPVNNQQYADQGGSASGAYPTSATIQGNDATEMDSETTGPTGTSNTPLSVNGYRFSGWSLSPDGSGTVYQSGDSLPITSGDVTLYAIWTPLTPNVQIVKSVQQSEVANGDAIDYTITVTNVDTGSTGPATNVVVTDPLPANTAFVSASIDTGNTTATGIDPSTTITALPVMWTIPTLDVGQQAVFNIEVKADAADPSTTSPVYADNTAHVSWTNPQDDTTDAADSNQVETMIDLPAISVVKVGLVDPSTLDANGFAVAEQTKIDYSVQTTNTGNVTLTGVSVTDPMSSLMPDWACDKTDATLAVGEKITCTGTYTLTQLDIDTGSVVNTATGTGNPPGCDPSVDPTCPVTGDDTVTTDIEQNPALTVAKTGTVDSSTLVNGSAVAGQTVIDYSVTATNTGDVTLTNVSISDPKVASWASCTPSAPATLGVGDTITCTGTYALTQTDIDTGSVVNTATGTGNPPGCADPSCQVQGDDTVTTNIEQNPALTVAKTGTVDSSTLVNGSAVAGQTVIDYSVTATNTGDVTLTNVSISDPKVASWASCTPAAPATLGVGDTITCTGTYTLTQLDIDTGSVVNTATGTGNPPGCDPSVDPTCPVTGDDTVTTDVDQNPELSVVKTGTVDSSTLDANGNAVAGQTKINYSVTATNTGDVTLTGVSITDPKVASWASCTPSAPATLGVGDTITCTGTYTLTQLDIDTGSVVNTATGTGNPPGCDPNSDPTCQVTGDDTVTTGVDQNPELSVVKTGAVDSSTLDGNGNAVANQTKINYSVTATNTGDVTLSNVTITDPKVAAWASCTPAAPATLGVGDTITCTGTYALTQTDIDHGSVENTATSTGNPPGCADPSCQVQGDDTVTNDIDQNPALTVAKAGLVDQSTLDANGNAVAGQTKINYFVTATNTGDVTLTGVSITDPKVASWASCTPSAPATLGVGDTITCTGTYTLTQLDIDTGSVVNTATGTGNPPGCDPNSDPTCQVTGDDTVTTDVDQNPGLSVVKTGTVDLSTLDGNGNAVAGQTKINYSVTATNSGDVTLTNVSISDPKVASWASCTPAAPATLAAGDTITCTGTYTLTQTDIDHGSVENTATSTGNPPGCADPSCQVTGDDTVTTDVDQNPGLDVVKTGTVDSSTLDANGNAVVNQTKINYSVTATNTGDVTLTGVSISDPKVSSWASCTPAAPATLASGDTITCTGTYTLTQLDIDTGSVVNTATGTGNPPGCDPSVDPTCPVTGDDTVTTDVDQNPELSVVKTGAVDSSTLDGNGNAVAGQTKINYSVTATNTGDVTLTGVTITDPKVSSWASCTPAAPATLAAGDTITCTGTYTLTQTDIDHGSVQNTATSMGNPPGCADPSCQVSGDDTVTTDVDQNPGLSVVKTGTVDLSSLDANGNAVAGQTKINYSVTATNSGDVTLTNVSISDPKVASWASCTPAAPATLAAGDTITCTGTYTLTQTDIDNGSVENTATGTGNPPGCDPSVDPTCPVTGDDTVMTDIDQNPGLDVVKTGTVDSSTLDGNGNAVAGQTKINYSVTATNTGDVTLTGVTITDPKVSSWASCTPAAPATLAAGDTITCAGVYTLTQTDIDNGSVENTATGTGNPPGCADPSCQVQGDDTVTTDIEQNPALTVAKTGTVDSSTLVNGSAVAGQTVIDYSVTATNTGDVTLTNVSISDPKVSTWTSCTPAAPATLAAGDTITCAGVYTLTQTDIDHGSVQNTATSTGNPPGCDPNSDPSCQVQGDDTVTTDVDQNPGLSVVKTGAVDQTSLDANGNAVAGQTKINYSVTATNTGDVTLTGVSISDPKVASWASCTPAAPATLTSGDTITCTGTYTLTQTDIDHGSVENTATSTGNPPGCDPSVDPSCPVTGDDTVTTDVDQNPGLSVVKTGTVDSSTLDGNGNAVAGQTKINYSVTATNTGDVTLTDVSISDPKVAAWASCTPAAPATLAAGAKITCTGTYTLTQTDIDHGSVENTATSTGNPPGCADPSCQVTGDDTVTTDVDQNPGLSVVKTGTVDQTSLDANGNAVAGQTKINYSVTATNTGDVTLSNVTITDPKVASWASCTPAAPATLAAGDTITCAGVYTLTQTDIDHGSVENTATSTGNPPGCADPSCQVQGDDTVTNDIDQNPALTVAKAGLVDQSTLDANGNAVANQTKISYSVTATNTGDVTLTGVSISDPKVASWASCTPAAPATLAAGDTITCTATYTLTQTDIDNGKVQNTATSTGNPPGCDPSSDPSCQVQGDDTVTTDVDQNPGLSVVKTGTVDSSTLDGNGNAVAGQTKINYSVTATNTGDVTLTGVSISDPKVSSWASCTPAAPATLAAGDTITCTGTYTLTQTDIDNGSVANTATGTGNPPGCADPSCQVQGDDTVTNDIDQNPALTVAKAGLVDQSTLDANGNAVANQTKINYSVTATNTGDVTLTGVTISDPKVSTWTSCTPAAPATLAAGAKITCTGTYTLTQTDIDYGSVANTATSTGNPPGCDPSVDPSCQVTGDDTVTNDVTQSPALSVVKTGVLSGGATDGATIAYTVTATNTGDVTLHDVVVTDALVPALTCDKSTLVPGETTTCTGTYTVKQTDVDAGQVVNTATADGIDPQGHHVDGQDDVTTDLTPAPSIDVVKTGTLAGDAKAGQAVNYQVVATNTGNVTLHNVTVTDPLVTNLVCGGNGTLLPGASVTCQGSYVLKQSDVNNGQVVNTATADGTDPKGNHVNGHDSATVDLPPAPSISLAKSASPNDSLSFQVGQLVTYSFVATNTGNVTLHGVTVTDPLPGLSPVACPTSATAWISGQVGVLNPGDQIVCTATYTLTQADINAGKVANTATTTGTSPTGTDVTGQDSLTLPETQSATLTLVKTAATIVGADASLTGVNPGATIYYTLTGKNTGNVTLTDVVITDDMGLDNWVCDHSSTDAILPGATITCTGSHVVPSTGVTGVVNNANITGKPLDPAGPTPKPADATVTVPVHQPPTATPETALITVSTDTGSTTTVAVLDGLPQPGSAPIIYPLTAIGSITAVAGDASAVTATIDPVTGKITVTSTESGVYLIPVTYVDGNGVTVTITHRVTVIAPDVATTSANQNKTLPGKPVSMSVLSRGGDHGAGLTVVSTTQPSNGVVTMNPDGSLTYTPNPGYSGPDSFTYTAQDSDGNQAVATVQLTVIPVANPDSGTTKVDTPLVIPGTQLLNNDSGTKLTITSVPKAGQTGYPTHGTVSYDPATGNATYTPNPGYSGPDSFTYVTTDQYGQLTTTVVNIMVTPTANPDQITVPQNSTNNVITVAGNDRGTGLVPTSVPARGTPGGPTHGTVQIVNGQVLYTPDQGFTGQDTFTYTVIDASGQPATSTVTLTVTAAPIPTYTVQTGGNLAPVSPLSGLLILLAAAGVTIIGFHSRFRRVCISRKGN